MKRNKKPLFALISVFAALSIFFLLLCFLLPPLFREKQSEKESVSPWEGTSIEFAGETVSAPGSSESSPQKPDGADGSSASSGLNTDGADGSSASSGLNTDGADGSSASSGLNTDGADGSSASSGLNTDGADGSSASSGLNTSGADASSASSGLNTDGAGGSSASSGQNTDGADTSSPQGSEAPIHTASDAPSQNSDGQELPEDRYAPVFLAFTASPQIKVGGEFNVHKYAGYGDDVDRNVELQVTGEVDTSKVGTYPIQLTLTDDAGHTTSKTMKVQVVSSLSSGSSGSGKKENFSDFIKNYKTDETSLGIDISRWQETVDFEKIKAAGCEFVYMRLGGFDEGEHYTDRYFKQNLAGAKAAGLSIGIYWHAEESSPEEIRASINYLMDVLGGEKLDFPIAFDWEDFMNFERYGMNLYDINNCFRTFVSEIEARGYRACMYGSKNRLETLWTLDPGTSVWLAHYTSATSYTGDYFMWQHSCTGRIDGINGDVDLDVFYHGRLK